MKHLIELHLHLDGSLRAETVWELAKEQGLELEEKTVEDIRFKMEVPLECKTLNEYLERFALPTKVLQTENAMERVAFELVEDLAGEGGDYEGYNSYIPRTDNELDEVFTFNEETRKIISNLWSKVKIAASNAN